MRFKKVAILGLGVTGMAVAKFLISKEKDVHVYDTKKKEDFDSGELKKLKSVHLNFETNDIDLTSFDCLVVSPGAPFDLPAIQQAKELGIEIHNDITLFIESWREIGPIIGVTGSNGKTTVVSLLYECLKNKRPTVLGGNIGQSPLDLLEGKHDKGTIAVLEISSSQFELFNSKHYLDICVITNLTSNHLDRYNNSMSEYGRIKTKGINSLETKTIVTPDDMGTVKYILPMLDKHDLTLVSLEISLDQVMNKGVYTDGQDLIYIDGSRVERLFSNIEKRKLVGLHNLYDITFVLAVLRMLNVEYDEDTIRSFGGLEHRIEKVREKDGVTYINDSKSTSPASIISALETVGNDRNVVLIAGGDDKDMLYSNLEDIFREKVKYLVILPGSIDVKLTNVAEKSGNVSIKKVKTMEEAVNIASEVADYGDIVLLSPGSSSKNMYKSFGYRGRHFKVLVNAI